MFGGTILSCSRSVNIMAFSIIFPPFFFVVEIHLGVFFVCIARVFSSSV